MIEERDELIERAVRALSAAPPVRAGAVARVLMAVRANHARPLPVWRRAARWFDETSVSAKAVVSLVAASLVIGFVARGTMATDDAIVGGALPVGTTLQPVANVAGESRAVPVAMALELANAKSVSVVGDFNGWDPAAAPMQRVGGTGLWSATLLARPGRHTYAFLVDGTTLVADPRAPRAKSTDFGGDASVLMVRTP
jgi:hypothetical protein